MLRSSPRYGPCSSTFLPVLPHQRRTAAMTLSPATVSARNQHDVLVAGAVHPSSTERRRPFLGVKPAADTGVHATTAWREPGRQVPEPDRSCLASGPWSLPHERVTSRCPHAPVPRGPP